GTVELAVWMKKLNVRIGASIPNQAGPDRSRLSVVGAPRVRPTVENYAHPRSAESRPRAILSQLGHESPDDREQGDKRSISTGRAPPTSAPRAPEGRRRSAGAIRVLRDQRVLDRFVCVGKAAQL